MSELASAPSGAAAAQRSGERNASGSAGDTETAVVPEQARPEDAATVRVAAAAASPSARPSKAGSVTPSTAAGATLVERYRLRTRVGSDTAAGAEFWRAEDTVLQRDVALTILRRLAPEAGALGGDSDPTGTARAGEMVVRALRSGSFEHSGCARLLDVLSPGASGMPDDVLGAAVTEWVPGRSLAETVADGLLKPLAAARAVAPLAAAAQAAHRHGLVLGCDHPQRVRITPDGHAQLCFALPRPDLTPTDDVRGLGSVLYTLLTSRWPLSGADAARAGLAAADRTAAGLPVAPSLQRPGVPVELDTLAIGTLSPVGTTGHVHTAAAVHRLLSEVVAEDDRVALFPPVHDGVPSAPGDVWQDGHRVVHRADPRRRRKLVIGVAALAVAALLVLGYVGVQVSSMFSDSGGPVIVVGNDVGAAANPPAEGSVPVGGVAAVANVDVYDMSGDSDNAGRVARVIDGDPKTNWRTYQYKQQFPALKPGVGIMFSFASAVQLSSLSITSPSDGTVVQVRSAPTPDAAFDDTTQITEATLQNGTTDVSLAGSQPVTHVLLWISKLAQGDGGYVSEIDEVQFHRAGG
ncbi:protein kinase family protein [Pseudonocardia sp.]|uniref:protein kinase family protein n=1 Tax=Pseudonocardia sp. TaxID=60912 RepID=UPI002634DCC7|nr:protein kinase family protein [Pseudonocardia sp.]MCW2722591.1 hypothetical protein [Pseudonocardia sp.]